MRHFISRLSCCLLALALSANQAALGAPAPAEDSKAAERAMGSEESNVAKGSGGTEESKEGKATEEPNEAKRAEESKAAEGLKSDEKDKPPAAPKPATHTVKKGPLKIEVTLSGAFEPQKMSEIALELKAWSTLSVVTAVEHGTQVKRGDLLVALDREKIDRAIADLRREHKTSDLALKLAERQLATLEKTTPMDLEANRRAQKMAREDLDYYFKVSRPLTLKSEEFYLKSAQQSFEYQEEELRQLEKMYEADDLTEETEEIILKRARNALEQARFSLEQSKILHDRTVNVTIPRRDVSVREAAKRIDLLSDEAKVAIPLTLKQQRLALEKLKLERARSEERLEKLLADRDAMTVKAPVAGVVYYGRLVHGRLSGIGSSPTSLRRGATLSPKQVFMTIIKPRPMFIRTTVPEKELHNVRAGIKGTAVPTGYPEMKLTAIVERVAAIPTGSGSFDTRITVALDDEAEPLMPGMTCKVTLVAYEKKAAVTVPPKCVVTDEVDKEKHYVYLLGEKAKPKKRYVTVGKRTAEKVEILKGLSEGDQVLLEPPEKKQAPKDKKAPKKKPPKDKKAAKKKG